MESKNIDKKYRALMRGYERTDHINTEWPMKDGMYQQYSNWEEDVVCESGSSYSLSPCNQ